VLRVAYCVLNRTSHIIRTRTQLALNTPKPASLILVWLAALLAFNLAGCVSPTATPAPPATPAEQAAQTASLTVQTTPSGALVNVDGEPQGVSPLYLYLSPGDHQISIHADGYAPLTETITLLPGQEGIYAPALIDSAAPSVTLTSTKSQAPWLGQAEIHVTATDNVGVVELQLLLDGELLGAADGGELNIEFAPADLTGVAPGGVYTLTARAVDAAGNVGQATLSLAIGPLPEPTVAAASATPGAQTPTTIVTTTAVTTTVPVASPTPTASPQSPATPSPAPTIAATAAATAVAATSLRVTSVTIPTYPYTRFVSSAIDPTLGNYPLLVLDRAAYEASNPQPVPVTYKLLVLENKYLRLSILPNLGGRIYGCVFKPTGNDEFYRNPVLKPTGWGPPSPPYPAGANWWLAAGGLEFGFPVEEHGYEWSARWGYDHVALADGGVMVSVFTRDWRRPYVVVDITLSPDTAYFTVRPRIVNPWGAPFRFKWWANAMLAPGAANAAGPELRFIFPNSEMTVHSTGDPSLPGPGQPLSWPITNGRDLSRLGNWNQYLGFFARPAAQGAPGPSGAESFMGVYDTAADEGMLRIFPSDVARGAKGFAAGWSAPLDWHNWTDDGSGYVELHGGLAPTFDDWYELPPGGEISWQETWYPVAKIGGVTYATAGGALRLAPGANALRVDLFPTRAVQGQLTVSLPGMDPVVRKVEISPANPFGQEIVYAAAVPAQGQVAVTLTDARGKTVLSYRGQITLR